MSLEAHRHCQRTILSAHGVESHTDETDWGIIDQLTLDNLPSDWKSYFIDEDGVERNITHDFASILNILNASAEEIKGSLSSTERAVRNIDIRLQSVEGGTGQLEDATITCYIAPKKEWFEKSYVNASSSDANTDTTHKFLRHNDGEYYTVNPNYNWGHDATIPEYAYSHDVDGEHRLYPGDDDNWSLQYAATTDNEKRKFPLHSLNAAMNYLRKFHSINGTVKYRVLTQYGEYDFGTTKQVVLLNDATGNGTLYIGPNQSNKQLQAMPCMKQGYARYTGISSTDEFQDEDLVKVKFVWSDDNGSNSRGIYYLAFQKSNTTFDGIGVALARSNNVDYTNIGATYMVVQPLSGQVTFKQCVFRNVQINSDSTSTSYPTV